MPPIPPYEYPPPVARSSPGDSPEQPKKPKVQPYQRPPKAFIEYVSPVKPVVPEQPRQQVIMSHPETVTLTPPQEVIRQPKSLTPVEEKELTPVKTSEPEKINEKLSQQPQSVKKALINSPAPTAKKLPKKMQFKGKKGRQRTEAEVIDLLTFVQNRNGAWPNDNYVSDQMRRYYRREYPEYFRKARKGKKVQSHGSAPIDLQSRRTGTNV